MVFGLCLVGVVLFVLLGCFLCCLPLFFVSAWWNRGIADEVTIASFCKAVTGTAVMARSANEEKKYGNVIVSVWTEPRYIKESEQSKVFPFAFHMTEEFSCHSSHRRICILF